MAAPSRKKNGGRTKTAPRGRGGSTPATAATALPHQAEAVELLKRELEEKLSDLTATNRQLKRKIFDLYTIFEISRNFNAVLDYNQLLDTFLFTSLAQVSAQKAALFLEDKPGDGEFRLVRCKGTGQFPDTTAHFHTGTQLTGFISRLNRPLGTDELLGEVASDHDREVLNLFHPGLAVPLIYQSQLTGILMLGDKLSNRPFSMDDIEFLSILGNQISVAIENTRLYEAEKLASKQLRSAQEQLLHTERLAALGEMSAKVAHEVNNPLGIINNYLLLIKKATAENSEAVHFTEVVGEEIHRIAKIVRQLLNFHRGEIFTPEPVNLPDLINDTLVLIERQLQNRNIELVRDFGSECLPVRGSAENLKQVFLNIVINALDAMGSEGRLTVRLDCRPDDPDMVRCSFCDTGPGIPPEIVPRIFEPFFTTKEPGKGTGLGLSVCYGIVTRHKGTIEYRNTDSGGCFEIRLPVARETHDTQGKQKRA